jgi:hypothetical protein
VPQFDVVGGVAASVSFVQKLCKTDLKYVLWQNISTFSWKICIFAIFIVP